MEGRSGVEIFNLGTGVGSSVLDVVHAYEKAVGHELPYEIKPRRAGDIATNYADCTKAREVLGWQAQYDLAKMCEDSWRWQSKNPNGYAD
jgi:UDP-glucose 4-epimerase